MDKTLSSQGASVVTGCCSAANGMAMEAKSVGGPPTPTPVSIDGNSGTSRRRIVKRARPVLSCVECRNRKLRCDRLEPCAQCQRSDRNCWYADRQNGDHGSDADTESAEQPAKRFRHSSLPDGEGHLRRPSVHAKPHDKPATASPDWNEVASRLGRLETMLMELRTPDRPIVSHNGDGDSSKPLPRVPRQLGIQTWLSLFDETNQAIGQGPKADALCGLVADLAEVQRRLRYEHQRAREPIAAFTISMVPVQKRMADTLPRKSLCDRLLQLYFDVSDRLSRVIHAPSFRQEYAQYWDGRGSSDTFLPRLLCVLCVAARFGTQSGGLSQTQFSTIHIPTACALVRNWLDEFRGRRTVDITILQTELLLLLAQRTIVEDQSTLWKQLGYVIRTAVDMGLQHDPANLAALSESRECRRRLWFAFLELNLGVSLTCHRPCAVEPGDYSCKPPRNPDDGGFFGDARKVPELGPLEQTSDNQVQACFSRSLPVRMEAAALLARLDAIQDYDEILDLGAKLERVLDNINCMWPPVLSVEKPTGWRRRVPLDLQTWLLLQALYRPFALSPACPPRISLAFLNSCTAVLTFLDALDDQILGYDVDVIPHHVEMKHAVIEAAFGVCWHIKQAREGNIPGLSWSSNDDSWDGVTPRYPWTGEDMVPLVARAIDWLLGPICEDMFDASHHLREVVALSILLGVVQGDTVQERIARVEASLRRIWARCSEMAGTQLSTNGGRYREQPGRHGDSEGVNGQASSAGAATWADLLRRWDRATAREGDVEVGVGGRRPKEVITVPTRPGEVRTVKGMGEIVCLM